MRFQKDSRNSIKNRLKHKGVNVWMPPRPTATEGKEEVSVVGRRAPLGWAAPVFLGELSFYSVLDLCQ
jgi:hypothetical protein